MRLVSRRGGAQLPPPAGPRATPDVTARSRHLWALAAGRLSARSAAPNDSATPRNWISATACDNLDLVHLTPWHRLPSGPLGRGDFSREPSRDEQLASRDPRCTQEHGEPL